MIYIAMSEGISAPEPHILDYAPDLRRRRVRRRMIWGTTFLIVIVATYLSRNLIMFRVQQAYWFERCMSHVTPPGTVLFEWIEDRQKALYLTKSDYFNALGYVPNVPPGITPPSRGTAYASGAMSIYIPKELRELEKYVYVGNPQGGLDDALFLGARKRPDGKSRLVIMRGSSYLREMIPGYMKAYVCSPPDLLHGVAPPVITAKPLPGGGAWSGDSQPHFVFLNPGVADPSDSTHITIPVKSGLSGIIDAYLQNDDTVTFSIRK